MRDIQLQKESLKPGHFRWHWLCLLILLDEALKMQDCDCYGLFKYRLEFTSLGLIYSGRISVKNQRRKDL